MDKLYSFNKQNCREERDNKEEHKTNRLKVTNDCLLV